MGILYRLSQLWQNLNARPLSQCEIEEIAVDLNPEELALFQRMSLSDQQHALRVYRLLKSVGQTDGDLLGAALLHDVGKVCSDLTAWGRSLAVLGETFLPGKAKVWGQSDTYSWKRVFVVREHHAVWGADLAEQAGSRAGVITLILRHQDTIMANDRDADERLMLLQWADNQN
jgi:predicted HD phosphohydrolase